MDLGKPLDIPPGHRLASRMDFSMARPRLADVFRPGWRWRLGEGLTDLITAPLIDCVDTRVAERVLDDL